MLKHTKPPNCLSVFDQFVVLAFKELTDRIGLPHEFRTNLS